MGTGPKPRKKQLTQEEQKRENRKGCLILFLLFFGLCAAGAVAAVIISGSSEKTYSIPTADGSALGCSSEMSVGDSLALRIHIGNSSGKNWAGTYVFIQDGGFTRDSFTGSNFDSGQDVGAGQLRFDGIPSGESQTYTARFTADQPGNHTVELQWWGSSSSSGASFPPSSTLDLSCAVAINP